MERRTSAGSWSAERGGQSRWWMFTTRPDSHRGSGRRCAAARRQAVRAESRSHQTEALSNLRPVGMIDAGRVDLAVFGPKANVGARGIDASVCWMQGSAVQCPGDHFNGLHERRVGLDAQQLMEQRVDGRDGLDLVSREARELVRIARSVPQMGLVR